MPKPQKLSYRYMVRLNVSTSRRLKAYLVAVGGGMNQAIVTRVALRQFLARQQQGGNQHGKAKRPA